MSLLPLVSADYEGFAAAFDSFLGEHRTLLSRELLTWRVDALPQVEPQGYAADWSSRSAGNSCSFLK